MCQVGGGGGGAPVIQLLCVKWGGSTSHSVVMCQVGGAPTPTGTLMSYVWKFFAHRSSVKLKYNGDMRLGHLNG